MTPTQRLDRDLALIETINVLSAVVEGLGSPLGHPAWLDDARARLVDAMRAMGASDEDVGSRPDVVIPDPSQNRERHP